ncbi:MAG: pyridoxamine 5'-phosphate oxidase family protein [Acidobacteriia bacterium]|nr:pyridoxamine 5'-phosphate oxidase family protein [Terriglobia bacterium]
MGDRETIRAFLATGNTLALATVGRDGTPHTTPLFYLLDEDLRLCWFSSRSSAHSRNLRLNPAAAVTVFRPAELWQDIRGVQMRGTVVTVTGQARRGITPIYAERFHLGPDFEPVIARSGLYAFDPSWVRYIDNSKGFGYRFEWTATGSKGTAATVGSGRRRPRSI